jgi:hypothetical protein
MGDTTDAPEGAEAPETGDTPAPQQDDDFKSDGSKERVLADLKKARDERAALAARLKEYEDRDKSEGEKLTDKLTAAEQRAVAAEQRAMRLEVAASKGLTPAQAKRLVGDTKEELEADADEILEAFPTKAGSPPPSNKPSPSGRGGTDPTEQVEVLDPAQLASAIPRP